jgi:tetratricopeptide (TPR) repeat protein
MGNNKLGGRKTVRRISFSLACVALIIGGCVQAGQQSATTSKTRTPASTDRGGFSHYGSYLAAKIARDTSDTASASEFFDLALSADPDNPTLVLRAFQAAMTEGRMERALELSGPRLEYAPDAPLARTLLAVEALRIGDADAAELHLAKHRNDAFANLLRPILLAWAALLENDVDNAIARLEPLATRKSFAVFHGYHKALILDVAGRTEAAAEAYRTTYDSGAKSSARIVKAYASFLGRTGKIDQAKEIVEVYLAQQPRNSIARHALVELYAGRAPQPMASTPQEGAAEAFFGVASSLARERSQSVARIHAHLALYLHPDLDTALVLLGEINDRQQRWQRSIDLYERVPQNSAFKWESRVRIADNLHRLNRVEEALELLRKMADERPENIDPLITSGDILRGEQRYSEAAEAYSEGLARIRTPQSHHWTLYYSRGIAYERSNQWDKAEPDFLKALELKPNQPLVLNYLGYSWIEKRKNLDQARGMIEKAVEQRPNDGFIVDSLGWALYRIGEYREAVHHLQRAVKLRPEDPILNDHLGDAYWQVGRRTEARFQWQHALEFGPDDDVAEEIKRKLRSGI